MCEAMGGFDATIWPQGYTIWHRRQVYDKGGSPLSNRIYSGPAFILSR